jgi:hypothetical protein
MVAVVFLWRRSCSLRVASRVCVWVWRRRVTRSGCEVTLVGLASGKERDDLRASYREIGELEEDVVSEGEASCHLKKSDTVRGEVRVPAREWSL